MIKNEHQYKITKAKIEQLAAERREVASTGDGLHPLMRQAQDGAHRSLIEELQAELVEYEELQKGKMKRIRCESLSELPEALIKARIARGLSHKEMADLLEMKEQQIQRYEATNYEAASFWRLLEIATVLCVEVKSTVTLKAFESIPSLEELTRLADLPAERKLAS